MALLINESHANPGTPLWTSSADVWALGASPASFGNATAPVAVAQPSGPFDVKYTYAEGYGYLYCSASTFLSAPVITLYLSASTGVLDASKSVGYITVSPVASPTGYWFDLSQLKYRDPAGFTNLYLMWSATTGGSAIQLSSVGAVSNAVNTAAADATVTKGTTPREGAAGVRLFTDV